MGREGKKEEERKKGEKKRNRFGLCDEQVTEHQNTQISRMRWQLAVLVTFKGVLKINLAQF